MSCGLSNSSDIRLALREPLKLDIFILPCRKSVQNIFLEIQSTDILLIDNAVPVTTVLESTKQKYHN